MANFDSCDPTINLAANRKNTYPVYPVRTIEQIRPIVSADILVTKKKQCHFW